MNIVRSCFLSGLIFWNVLPTTPWPYGNAMAETLDIRNWSGKMKQRIPPAISDFQCDEAAE